MKLFGRNPLVWLAALQSVLAVFVTIPQVGLSQEMAAGVMVVLSGLLAAWEAATARPLAIPALVGAVRTVLVGLMGFGLVIPEATLAALVSALALVLALVVQPNTTPAIDPAPGFLR